MTAVSSGGGYQSFLGCPSPRGTRELKRSHDDEAYAPTDPFAKLSSSSSSITNVEIEEEAYMSFSGIPNLGVSKKDSTSALGFGVDNVNSVFLLKKMFPDLMMEILSCVLIFYDNNVDEATEYLRVKGWGLFPTPKEGGTPTKPNRRYTELSSGTQSEKSLRPRHASVPSTSPGRAGPGPVYTSAAGGGGSGSDGKSSPRAQKRRNSSLSLKSKRVSLREGFGQVQQAFASRKARSTRASVMTRQSSATVIGGSTSPEEWSPQSSPIIASKSTDTSPFASPSLTATSLTARSSSPRSQSRIGLFQSSSSPTLTEMPRIDGSEQTKDTILGLDIANSGVPVRGRRSSCDLRDQRRPSSPRGGHRSTSSITSLPSSSSSPSSLCLSSSPTSVVSPRHVHREKRVRKSSSRRATPSDDRRRSISTTSDMFRSPSSRDNDGHAPPELSSSWSVTSIASAAVKTATIAALPATATTTDGTIPTLSPRNAAASPVPLDSCASEYLSVDDSLTTSSLGDEFSDGDGGLADDEGSLDALVAVVGARERRDSMFTHQQRRQSATKKGGIVGGDGGEPGGECGSESEKAASLPHNHSSKSTPAHRERRTKKKNTPRSSCSTNETSPRVVSPRGSGRRRRSKKREGDGGDGGSSGVEADGCGNSSESVDVIVRGQDPGTEDGVADDVDGTSTSPKHRHGHHSRSKNRHHHHSKEAHGGGEEQDTSPTSAALEQPLESDSSLSAEKPATNRHT
eukprot:TRINITY_DN6614_c0_g1_i2.p1 TRINITY_DN6614_c0_g1~~TRINITY_DN6614_c0_g1_i2.p1  ORF type:complete len:741 (+),score=139.10 TRINITY_DN6614_c0_g1_i2:246-2468(+)